MWCQPAPRRTGSFFFFFFFPIDVISRYIGVDVTADARADVNIDGEYVINVFILHYCRTLYIGLNIYISGWLS